MKSVWASDFTMYCVHSFELQVTKNNDVLAGDLAD